ncbi:MAG: phosphodiester glycosidase family protein [Eubacteriales bacterium]|nr:phosphodiester glycosidase family protein [Eubacteriales bacterium]
MMNPRTKSIKRLITAIVVDLVVLGAFLGAFTYFYFLRERDYAPKALTSPTPVAEVATTVPAVDAQTSAAPTQDVATPTPEVIDTGLLGGKYAEKFTTGEVEQTDTSYRSANVSIEVTKNTAGTESKPIVYYLADIYIKDISSFRTAVALDYKDQNEGDRKNVMSTLQLSQLTKSIIGLSGDNFAFHDGIVVRNGVEWERILPVYGDVCVLYYDGTMETYSQKIKNAQVDEIYAKEPYQIWTFGPQLLEDGQVPSSFANRKANPLSAIGYYEPGHYCFILVDGRQKDYSWGMTYAQLAQVFYDLGCKFAFNLDGGDTAVMTYLGEWRSQPEESSPRDTSDILYVVEPTAANGQ